MANIYTPLKIFHFQDKLKSLTRDNKKILAPIHIRIKPTNVCNHDCNYCAYRVDDLQLGQDMVVKDAIPRQKMIEILNDIIAMGVKAVTFSGGGEPLVYPHMVEVLQILSKSPVKFASLTNGARLSGEIAELFAKNGTWVRISMDGWDDKSYSQIRGVGSGEFAMVMKNIVDFKKIGGKCRLGVSFIVDKQNATHVYEMIMRTKEAGVDSIKISPCIIDNDSKKNNQYHEPHFGEVKDQIARAKKVLSDGDIEIFDAFHDLDEKFNKSYNWCPYCQILPVIGADQRVYTCHDKAYNLKDGLMGSLKNQSFKEFWFANKETFFQVDPSKHCNHHCVVNNQNRLICDFLDADAEHLAFV